jgi:hypothetical protein
MAGGIAKLSRFGNDGATDGHFVKAENGLKQPGKPLFRMRGGRFADALERRICVRFAGAARLTR